MPEWQSCVHCSPNRHPEGADPYHETSEHPRRGAPFGVDPVTGRAWASAKAARLFSQPSPGGTASESAGPPVSTARDEGLAGRPAGGDSRVPADTDTRSGP